MVKTSDGFQGYYYSSPAVFLLAKGVESELLDTDHLKVKEQMESYVKNGGTIFACGTCLKIRDSQRTELCPVSTMKDMYELIKESDRIITFQLYNTLHTPREKFPLSQTFHIKKKTAGLL